MLGVDLKKKILIDYKRSQLLCLFKKQGFSNVGIRMIISVLLSFYQNAPSFIFQNKRDYKVTSSGLVYFSVRTCDHRNYYCYQYVLQRYRSKKHGSSGSSSDFDQLCSMYLWMMQMYMLSRIYSHVYRGIFSGSKDNDILKSLMDDIRNSCATIESCGDKSKEQEILCRPDFKELYLEDFAFVMLGTDCNNLEKELSDAIKLSRSHYLLLGEEIRDLIKNEDMVPQVVTCMIYQSAIRHFLFINEACAKVSCEGILGNNIQYFEYTVFNMLVPFALFGISDLSAECKCCFNIKDEDLIVDECKTLLSGLYNSYASRVSHNDLAVKLSIFSVLCAAARQSLDITAGGCLDYNTLAHSGYRVIIYDLFLCFDNVFDDSGYDKSKLHKVLKLENMMLLYNVILKDIFQESSAQFLELQEDLCYALRANDGTLVTGCELLYELLCLCYYAIYVKKVNHDCVKCIFDICYGSLVGFKDSTVSSDLVEYRRTYVVMQELLNCTDFSLSGFSYDQGLFCTVMENLLLIEQIRKVQMDSADKLIRCNAGYTGRIKVQQAVVAICMAFRNSSNDSILKKSSDGSSLSSIAAALMLKLLYGNCLERALILKMMDTFFAAHFEYIDNNSSTKGTLVTEDSLFYTFENCLSVTLSVLARIESNLPFIFPDGNVELSRREYLLYGQLYNFIENHASALGVQNSVGLCSAGNRLSASFCRMLSKIPTLPDMDAEKIFGKVCNVFDRPSCILAAQFLVSYACSHGADELQRFIYAQLHSLSFLLFSVLSESSSVCFFRNLYGCYVRFEDNPDDEIKRKFYDMLDHICGLSISPDFLDIKAINKLSIEEEDNAIHNVRKIVRILINESRSIDPRTFKGARICLHMLHFTKLYHCLSKRDILDLNEHPEGCEVFAAMRVMFSEILRNFDKLKSNSEVLFIFNKAIVSAQKVQHLCADEGPVSGIIKKHGDRSTIPIKEDSHSVKGDVKITVSGVLDECVDSSWKKTGKGDSKQPLCSDEESVLGMVEHGDESIKEDHPAVKEDITVTVSDVLDGYLDLSGKKADKGGSERVYIVDVKKNKKRQSCLYAVASVFMSSMSAMFLVFLTNYQVNDNTLFISIAVASAVFFSMGIVFCIVAAEKLYKSEYEDRPSKTVHELTNEATNHGVTQLATP